MQHFFLYYPKTIMDNGYIMEYSQLPIVNKQTNKCANVRLKNKNLWTLELKEKSTVIVLHISIYNHYVIFNCAKDLFYDSDLSLLFFLTSLFSLCLPVSYITHNAIRLHA